MINPASAGYLKIATSHNRDIREVPFLDLPTDVLKLIGHFLPQSDAIKFTSTCVKLFNLRFDGRDSIIRFQCWKRIPGSRELFSSIVEVPNGREIVTRSIKRNEEHISGITLTLRKFLTINQLAKLIVKLRTLSGLKTLHIDCAYLRIIDIYSLLFGVNETVGPLLSNLTLSNLVATDILSPILKAAGQFEKLKSLSMEGKFITLPKKIKKLTSLQFLEIVGENLSSLPPELGQLSNLKNLMVRAQEIKTLPKEMTLS